MAIKLHFLKKRFGIRPTDGASAVQEEVSINGEVKGENESKKNKKQKKDKEMNTEEQIKKAEEIVEEMPREVKVLKKEKGLIERTESSKIILTEDNRQVLND